MSGQSLPDRFSDLEPFVADWDLPGTAERYAARLTHDMDTLRAFHDAVQPRLSEIRELLDQKPLDGLSDEERRLGRLAFAWIPVAEAVQVFRQNRVPDSKGYWTVRLEPDL